MNWFYTVGSESRGPVDEATLRQMIARGEIPADALICNEAMPDWCPIVRALPPELPLIDSPGKTQNLAPRQIARRLYFGILALSEASTLISFPMSFESGYWVAYTISACAFLAMLLLLPFAIVENTQRRSTRLLIYLLLPVILRILGVLAFFGPHLIDDDIPKYVEISMFIGSLVSYIRIFIAVDGFARLREESAIRK